MHLFSKLIIMDVQDSKNFPKYSQEEETHSPGVIEKNGSEESDTEDTDPPLDEEYLERKQLNCRRG